MDKGVRLQPSKVKYVKDKFCAGEELTEGEREVLNAIAADYLKSRDPKNAIYDFYKWIVRGESILGPLIKELESLRELTSADGDRVSCSALFDLFDKYYNRRPKNEVDIGVNWVIDKFREELKNIHKI